MRTKGNLWQRIVLSFIVILLIIATFFVVRFFVKSGSGLASEAIIAPALELDSSKGNLYRFVAEKSEAKFKIDELLLGEEVRVVGRTSELAGDIIVDEADLSSLQIGVVRINVRTLITDNQFRNRAMRAEILESSKPEYEFSEFTPTAVESPAIALEVGQEVEFLVTGDLKVRDISKPVSFAATLKRNSETRMSGSAKTVILREDFELTIPEAKGVAQVSEEVTLELKFVAELVEDSP